MPALPRNNIKFFFLSKAITLRNRNGLKRFIKRLIEREGYKVGSINYVFCSDKYLIDINRQFLNHDYYTDIITFKLSNEKQPIHGEIYISLDRVRDNASHLGESLNEELHRVIFHGAIHLCGYRDMSSAEKSEMRKKENQYLEEYL